MNCRLTIFAAVLLLCFAAGVSGQTRCQGGLASATARFDQATVKYGAAFGNLLRLRAANRFDRGGSSAARIAQALATGDDPYTIENGYEPSTALLFYAYEGSNLDIWLITEAGVQAYCRRPLPARQLTKAIDRLRNALGVGAAQRSRTARLLVQAGASVPAPPKLPLGPTIATLSGILIPRRWRLN